ncbi:hypothetical protein BC832DRAFT_566054 [Gaertneriomyces semiglobifer]|nr:hypothetical protein BC832DRAFT_566054 [Gaertneriomyces semiglobifer]
MVNFSSVPPIVTMFSFTLAIPSAQLCKREHGQEWRPSLMRFCQNGSVERRRVALPGQGFEMKIHVHLVYLYCLSK